MKWKQIFDDKKYQNKNSMKLFKEKKQIILLMAVWKRKNSTHTGNVNIKKIMKEGHNKIGRVRKK